MNSSLDPVINSTFDKASGIIGISFVIAFALVVAAAIIAVRMFKQYNISRPLNTNAAPINYVGTQTNNLTGTNTSVPFSGVAITSLVLGAFSILSIPVLGLVCGIISLILGIKAHTKTKQGLVRGNGVAVAGVTLGTAGIFFGMLSSFSIILFLLPFLSSNR
jgi:hypothetical protein